MPNQNPVKAIVNIRAPKARAKNGGETRFPSISRNCINTGNDSERRRRERKSGVWGFLPKKNRKI